MPACRTVLSARVLPWTLATEAPVPSDFKFIRQLVRKHASQKRQLGVWTRHHTLIGWARYEIDEAATNSGTDIKAYGSITLSDGLVCLSVLPWLTIERKQDCFKVVTLWKSYCYLHITCPIDTSINKWLQHLYSLRWFYALKWIRVHAHQGKSPDLVRNIVWPWKYSLRLFISVELHHSFSLPWHLTLYNLLMVLLTKLRRNCLRSLPPKVSLRTRTYLIQVLPFESPPQRARVPSSVYLIQMMLLDLWKSLGFWKGQSRKDMPFRCEAICCPIGNLSFLDFNLREVAYSLHVSMGDSQSVIVH